MMCISLDAPNEQDDWVPAIKRVPGVQGPLGVTPPWVPGVKGPLGAQDPGFSNKVDSRPPTPVSKESSEMTLEITKGRRKPFDVEFVEVTDENMEEVAAWCNGRVVRNPEGATYVKIEDKNAVNSRQTKGFAGDFIVRHPGLKSFKSFGKRSFAKTYEPRQSEGTPDGFVLVTAHKAVEVGLIDTDALSDIGKVEL